MRSIFTEPSKPAHPAYRYGMLVFCLGMFAWYIVWRLNLPPTYHGDRYGLLVVTLMLFFNHLAYQFNWPASVTVALRILAWGWLVFGSSYLFYSLVALTM